MSRSRLIGSDLGDELGAAVPPESLHRAAQLAMEITLRWAKLQKVDCEYRFCALRVLAGSAAAQRNQRPWPRTRAMRHRRSGRRRISPVARAQESGWSPITRV